MTILCSCAQQQQQQQQDTEVITSSERTTYNFNVDWKFIKSNPKQAQDINYNDATWETISCPHTFNDVDTFDDLSHGHHDGEDNQWRGTVWYRKHFKLPKDDKGKKVFIEFESVRQIADVYINGVHLGQNQTGFIPFGFDLTPHLKFGEENIIAVKVNNDRGDHFRENFPLVWNHEHWHPTHGGIYRNVFLHTMDPLHITLPLYDNLETVGTYVYAENISEKSADITVETEIQNEHAENKNITLVTQIVDNDGAVVAHSNKNVAIPSGQKMKVTTVTNIQNPQLWYTRYPYMYKVVSAIKESNKVIDTYESPLGIRNFDFNKDSGFWINGEQIKLHGWGQKPTNAWAGLGAALPDWLRDFTFKLMDEAGGNFIRWGHCAASPAEVDMGDKYGFVTLMPGVSGESEDEGETWDIRYKAFKDLIVYYRNHPSIFIWEGGNWAESEAHYKEILEAIKTFDPKGKRLMGNRRADVKNDSEGYVSIEIGTEGWEREYPDLPIIESEYNREEAPRRIWDKNSPDDNFYNHPNISKNTYKLSSEEFAVRQADHWWNKMGKKAYHSGGANWIFSDGPHGGRCPTEVTRASGEVDAVRLPKEAFYALKAMWRPEPQVHIVGHWNYEVGTKKTMYVMSNCASVKLYVNDKLVGTNSNPENGYVFKFDNVAWESGKIKAEGFIDDALKTTQTKETTGEPAALKLTSITGPEGWLADGSDVALIDVEVVDAQGRRCPLAKGRVDFTISGPAIWRGGYNSGKPNSTNNLFLDIEAGINRVAVRSVLESGTVTIMAKKPGFKDVSVTLKSLPIDFNNGLTTTLPQVYTNVLTKEPLPEHIPEMPEYIPGVKNRSELFRKFSYTGDGKAMLRTNMHWGKKAYTDLEYNYTVLPRYLNESEYVRTPNSDNRYWARDQLQFIAGKKMHIYVLHDDTVPRPEFLLRDYEDTGDNVNVVGASMSVFHRVAEEGESIIMAGNSDGDAPENCRMYTVMVKEFK
ncbi:beta-galactosidase (GH2) [Formosa agariphila KMM 3901]|uniref:Beta-glucuronidase n=1 Tax=Formosa agariphila (strain DSM 15362 / KCTC 12365 / LMG 23005 / KMM 3901 / M-2Alg 35-1) TaxID=1347342 RepID=PLH17_FORAG|nr:RecName: Full=Beta-glucuronidase; AltName: Full=Glycosyl hydrolase 2 family protein P17; Short=P17_GH2; AltName: Full=Polysaccharide utilization locus H protein P17; Short=PUL H protein P17 [Formosa agariphila KMM 3901]CDF79918.1 beta-galactosidase (GH2) [Formosa agariphila KMM 3901]